MEKTISETICAGRKAKGLTQEQLGALLGVSGQAVSKWEKGENLPDIQLLPALCGLLGVSAGALLGMGEAGCAPVLPDLLGREGDGTEAIRADFSKGRLTVREGGEMGFAVSGGGYFEKLLDLHTEQTAYMLRILSDEGCLKVLCQIPFDRAVTRAELGQTTGMDEEAINKVVLGLMKRDMAVCETDPAGKRGYMQGPSMAGVYLILAGCRLLGADGAGGCVRVDRK